MAAPTSFIFIVAIVSSALAASLTPFKREEGECGRVWVTIHSPELTVSPGITVLDAIELNWDFRDCDAKPKKIGLFNSKPTNWDSALVKQFILTDEGYIITNVSLGNTTLPGGWDSGVTGSKGSHCLWPWIAIGSQDEFIADNCLKIQPTWMEDNYEKIKHMRIGHLLLPGAHNAGSFAYDTEINQATRDRFGLCQDRSIWEQLVHGIRYLDLRIAYYDIYPTEEEKYYLNHNFVRIRRFLPLLREIKSFLDSTQEVVIIDAHHFPFGFYNNNNQLLEQVHYGLLDMIEEELSEHIASFRVFGNVDPLTGGPKLSDLVSANKRLIVSYVDNTISSANDWLWPNLPHLWANTNNPTQLFTYLDSTIPNQPTWNARTPLHSAMAQTTATAMDIVFLRGSIRESADLVNRDVTSRLRTNQSWRSSANIISTDFFLGNDVIDVAIDLNLARATA